VLSSSVPRSSFVAFVVSFLVSLLVSLLALATACSNRSHTADAGLDAATDGAVDTGPDAPARDGAIADCACLPGDHTTHIFLMSQDGEVWSFDPEANAAEFVVGPVCRGIRPFSMAVDARGRAFIQDLDSLGVEVLDLTGLSGGGACEASAYERRDPRYGLFGMSFATPSASDTCADLFVFTYDGDGPFSEGPDFGRLGVIDPATGALADIALIDYDGGELSGTGDGRLFAFTGVDPAKLVEYDEETGAALETIPLEGFSKTNASAMAFFAGDLYLFVEGSPPGCAPCLQATCSAGYEACLADDVCSGDLACSVEAAALTDACGGLLSAEMMSCLEACTDTCFTPPRARVSEVWRFDLDGSDGAIPRLTRVVDALPIRVVGAASSPCVPVGPI